MNRWSKDFPCRVCGGYPELPSGIKRRCAGYLSACGRYARCTREEHALGLVAGKGNPATYTHFLAGKCDCGEMHGGGIARDVLRDLARAAQAAEDGWTCIQPVPPDALRPWFKHRDHGIPSCAPWAYKDAAGSVIQYVARFNLPRPADLPSEAKPPKVYLPRSYWKKPDGSFCWRWKRIPGPQPLFNLDELARRPDAPVLVVEGEKCATAAARMQRFAGHVVITWHGGVDGVDRTDWKSLQGRSVAIWPDFDVPTKQHPLGAGIHAAQSVASQAYRAGALDVRIFDLPPGLPPGFDLADLAALEDAV